MPKRKDKTQSPEERLQEMLVPESEQPYPVPENWCWTYWGVVGDFFAGSGFKEECQGKQDLPIPFYKVGSLKSSDIQGYLQDISNTVDDEIRELLHATLIPKNSLIFAKIGEAIRLNRRALNSAPCCIDNNLMAFISKKCNFVYVYFWSQNIDLYKFTNATTVPAIRKSDLESISFPLPPLPEQQRIVDRIESLFSKLDAAKTKAQAVVDSHESRKAAILHKAFTGELTKKWREKKNQSFAEWTQTDIKHVVDSIRYGTSEKSDYSNTGTPVLRIPNIGAGNIDFSDIKFLSQEPDDASLVHKGDILIIRSNGSRELVGNAALIGDLDRAYAYASFLIRLRPSDCINPNFLVLYLNSIDARRQMFNSAKSSAGINNINSQEIGRISFHMPGLEEQEAIVSLIENILDKEQESVDIANIMIERVDAMKKSILSRAFRGELGTNDPREESAVGLLMQDIEEK